MKINFDKQKIVESVTDTLQKSSEIGKKVATEVQGNVQNFVDKTRHDNYMKRLKKYNPLFPEEYQSEKFNVPNMIMIVDDAVREDS